MSKKKSNKTYSTVLPDKFPERLEAMFPGVIGNEVRASFVERPTTLRINRIKCPVILDTYGKKQPDEVIEFLKQAGFLLEQVSWYEDAFILQNKTKRELTDTEPYKLGKIYIQSLASMSPPLVLQPQPGEKVLDLTAAPGSKTSQIAAMMAMKGELVANDNNKVRFFKLKHNMELLGVGSGVSKDEAVEWKFTLRMEHGGDLCREFPDYFDKILLDAPCSAEARFVANNPNTFGYWSERKIKEMAYKQRSLLFAAWGALKPGGTLVYSTCTFAPEENEIQIERLLDRYSEAELQEITYTLPPALPALTKWKNKDLPNLEKTYRIKPTPEIEGFFVALLKKL